MVRVPGPEDVQQVPARVTRDPGVRDIDSGLQTVGRQIVQIGTVLERRRQGAEDSSFLARLDATARQDATRLFDTVTSEAEGSATGTAERFNTEWEDGIDGLIQRTTEAGGFKPSQEAMSRARDRLVGLGGSFGTQAITFEDNARIEQYIESLDGTVNDYAVTALNNPDQWDDILADVDEAFGGAGSFLTPQQVAEGRTSAVRSITTAAVQGTIRQNPQEAVDMLNDGVFDRGLTAPTKNALLNTARIEVDRRSREADARLRVERSAYLDRTEDYVNFLRSGGNGSMEFDAAFSKEELVSILGTDIGLKVQEQIDRAIEFGGDVVAIQSAPVPEAEAMLAERAERLKTPEDFTVEQTEFTQLRTLLESELSERAGDLNLDNLIGFLRSGEGQIPEEFTPEALVELLGDERGSEVSNLIDRALQFGEDITDIATGTPEEAAGILTARAEGLEGTEEFVQEQRDFQDLVGFWEDVLKARAEDPITETLRQPHIRAAYDTFLSDAAAGDSDDMIANGQNFIRLAGPEMDRLGVPPHLQKVLPNSATEEWARVIRSSTPDEAVGLIDTLHGAFGEAGTTELAAALSVDAPALAMVTFFTPFDRNLSADLMTGIQLVGENADLKPSRTDYETPLSEMYHGLFETQPGLRSIYRDAAATLYAAGIVGRDQTTFDSDLYDLTLRRLGGARLSPDGSVTGGPFDYQGINTLPLRHGEGAEEFIRAVGNLTPSDLVEFGNGAPVGTLGFPITATEIREDAEFVSLSFGRYMIRFSGLGFAGVQNPTDGNPAYVLDLDQLQRARGASFQEPSAIEAERRSGVSPEQRAIAEERLQRETIPDLTEPPILGTP